MGKRVEFSDDDDDGPLLPVSAEPDEQLFKDVRAFAAQLGLGGGMDEDAFADFAPDKAGNKVAKAADAKDSKKSKDGRDGGKGAPADVEAALPAHAAAKDKPKPRAAPTAPVFDPLPELPKGGAPPRSLLKKDDEGRWYEIAATLPQPGKATKPLDDGAVEAARARGMGLLAAEAAAFETAASRQKGGSNLQWLQQAQRGGTTSDKVAAMAVLVQESPLANLRALDGLIGMAGKKGGARAVVGTALDALKELWLEVLLPTDRKLRFLAAQPLETVKPGRDGDRALMLWTFEDAVKRRYATFIESLDALSRDNLEFVKDRASKVAADLLAAAPEGEAALLSTLVNKLGDPSRKLASKVGYLLTTILAAHPGMKGVVVREVERFAFRPGLADRARYYAVVFLNQMVLTHKDAPMGGQSLARRLVDVYFTLFKLVMEGRVGTAAARGKAARDKAARQAAARAARRGKKKAAPVVAKKSGEEGQEEGDDEGAAAENGGQTGEMDARMLSALITGVRRAFPFVAAEEVEPLIEAHADALFRLTHAAGSIGVATQALLLLHQLMTARNSVSDRFYRALYAVLVSPELPRSTKAPMFLSLLWKAVRADVSARRVAAFVKRLLQVAAEAPPNFACGCLVLVSETLKARPGLWNAVLQGEERADGGVERFVDLDGDDGDGGGGSADAAKKGKKGKGDNRKKATAAAAYHSGSDEEEGEGEEGAKKPAAAAAAAAAANAGKAGEWPPPGGYDARKREPQYANADKSCLWELLPLAAHAHPSVAAMARTLLAGANVTYDGDPLKDLTLHAFLDKFVQKKAKVVVKGDSLMQPLRAAAAAAAAGPGGAAAAAAVGAALSELDARDVAPDDAFFQKFYAVQAARGGPAAKKKKKKVGDGDGDEALVSDEEDGSGDDSDAMDDFLAGEEDGGEEGIGADPDSGYDYDQLAAAMGEDSDADEGESDFEDEGEDMEGSSDGEGEEEEESESDGDVGGPFASASDDEEGGLSGAEFSDLSSGSGGSESVDGSDLKEGSSGSGGSGGGSGSSDEDLDGDAGSLGSLSESDEDEKGGSSDEDDAEADAEVAALLAAADKAQKGAAGGKKGTKRGREAEADSDSDGADGINPFELAEATDSEGEDGDAGAGAGISGSEEEGEEESGSEGSEEDASDSDGDDLMLDDDLGSSDEDGGGGGGGGGGKGGSKKDRPVFASAADFDDLIVRDLQGEADEEETAAAKARAGFRGKGGGGRGGGRGAGRGRGDAKRQRR